MAGPVIPYYLGGIAQGSDGAQIPVDSAPQTFTYDGTFIATIVIVYAGVTYTQTWTNDGTNITSISNWVAS